VVTQGLPFERKVKIARGLAEALNYLHEQEPPMIHGRVKPSNIMLTSDNKVKLSEYGRIFRLADNDVIANKYMGYMAPELFTGGSKFGHDVTVATDVYAYGMTLVYLFTKKEPYEGGAYDHVKGQASKADNDITTALRSGLPETLCKFIKQCISPTPADRGTFGSILKQLKPFDKIILENLSMTQGEATAVWGAMKPAVPWKDLKDAWQSQFGQLSSQQEVYLRAFIGVPLDSIISYNEVEKGRKVKVRTDPLVTKTDFDNFLKAFGPINKSNVNDLFVVMHQLVEAPWFYGKLSHDDARYELRGGKDLDKKQFQDNAYLVHLNSHDDPKEDKPFVLAYRASHLGYKEGFNFDLPAAASGKTSATDQVAAQLKHSCTTKSKNKVEPSTLKVCPYPRDPVFRRINPANKEQKGAGTSIGYVASSRFAGDAISTDDTDLVAEEM